MIQVPFPWFPTILDETLRTFPTVFLNIFFPNLMIFIPMLLKAHLKLGLRKEERVRKLRINPITPLRLPRKEPSFRL